MSQPAHNQAFAELRFHDSRSYLQALREWLHQLLRWQIAHTREIFGALADDEYRGLYIPDAEIEIQCFASPVREIFRGEA